MLVQHKSYKPGDLIWSEEALVCALHVDSSPQYCAYCLLSVSQQPLLRCSRCKHVFYCSRICQKSHWCSHKQECACIVSSGAFPGATIRLLFNIIVSKVYKNYPFFELLVSHVEELNANDETRLMMEQAYAMLMVFSNQNISISKSCFFRLFGRVKINAFHLTSECGDEIGVALFERSSKLDHSCLPNADFAFVGKRIKVIATDEILDASQIRISYVDLLMSMKRRQEELFNGYLFHCNCPRCSDLEQDFDTRIPPCCGRRMRGLKADALEHQEPVSWPSEANAFLPNLAKYSTVAPEEVYVCGKCHRCYSAAVFDALECRCYEINTLKDAVGLYRACAAAANTGNNEYLHLVYNHQGSLPLLRLCRTMVMTYRVAEDNLNGEELDLMLEVGLRLARCFDSVAAKYHSFHGHLFVCSLVCALLGLLGSVVSAMEAHLSLSGGGGDDISGVTLERLEHFSAAFVRTAVAFAPCIKRFAPHLPGVSEQLQRLRCFANNLNVQI